MRRTVDVDELVARAGKGDPRAVARLISLVENAAPQLRAVMAALAPLTGRAHVVGLTGAPGVGKSTTTSALLRAYRAAGKRVGVLAVDPSSPFSGGALLGDRVRMNEHGTDPEVYIRSMASRGHLGGLAVATPQALRVLDAAGCDVVLVETVGVGQAEVDIASLADTTLLVVAPGMGDGVQVAKAGVMEIADLFVVNKADRDGTQATVRDIRNMVALAERGHDDWKPPIITTIASDGDGIDELHDRIEQHRTWATESGDLHRRRVARASREIEAIALAALRTKLADVHAYGGLPALAESVAAAETDPYQAADTLLAMT